VILVVLVVVTVGRLVAFLKALVVVVLVVVEAGVGVCGCVGIGW
jgi:hypothetical protein